MCGVRIPHPQIGISTSWRFIPCCILNVRVNYLRIYLFTIVKTVKTIYSCDR